MIDTELHRIERDQIIEQSPELYAASLREQAADLRRQAAILINNARTLEGVGQDLPPKAKATLDFITSFVNTYGYTPTLHEITEGLELTSKSMAHARVTRLVERGLVKRDDHNRRIILLK